MTSVQPDFPGPSFGKSFLKTTFLGSLFKAFTYRVKMASLLTARGAFAARTAAPVKCLASMRSAMTSRAIAPVAPRTAQISFLGGSFAGSSLVRMVTPARGGLLVMANAKKSIACTKEGTNRKRRRASGFKARMATTNGRKVLKARRAKGRHVICPASERKSGGKK